MIMRTHPDDDEIRLGWYLERGVRVAVPGRRLQGTRVPRVDERLTCPDYLRFQEVVLTPNFPEYQRLCKAAGCPEDTPVMELARKYVDSCAICSSASSLL